ncbi:uncharacterized protein LOC143891094 [Tasmannia lanceolata]|uniref:uncharacterized protein LOC143891094 n=1 Tax=Tasmannia lanceolata TaxID=3420 RepID=UPI0040628D4E
MTSFNPLAMILEDNKLTGPNYVDWKRNLTLVLTIVKVYWVLTTEAPELAGPDTPQDVRDRATKSHEDDQMAKCYILGSMSNVLQQLVGMASSMDIMHNLRKMFGEQDRSARQIAIKGLVSTKMVERTLVRVHMLKMMGYLNDLEVLEAMLDGESQVDKVLASLPPSFSDFVMNYNMNKLLMTLTELLNHLQSTVDLQKKNKKSSFLVETNVVSTPKPKGKGKRKSRGQRSKKNIFKVKNKKTFKKKSTKTNDACFHYGKVD